MNKLPSQGYGTTVAAAIVSESGRLANPSHNLLGQSRLRIADRQLHRFFVKGLPRTSARRMNSRWCWATREVLESGHHPETFGDFAV